MKNMKCSTNNHKCPEELDTCCQFCPLNYSPCSGKCSGCWDEIADHDNQIDNLVVLNWDRAALDQVPNII